MDTATRSAADIASGASEGQERLLDVDNEGHMIVRDNIIFSFKEFFATYSYFQTDQLLTNEQTSTIPLLQPCTPRTPNRPSDNELGQENDDEQHDDVDMLATPSATPSRPDNHDQSPSRAQDHYRSSTYVSPRLQPPTAHSGLPGSSTHASSTVSTTASTPNPRLLTTTAVPTAMRPLTPASSSSHLRSRASTPGGAAPSAPIPALSYDSFWSSHSRTAPGAAYKR
jgi:hypothetical protein